MHLTVSGLGVSVWVMLLATCFCMSTQKQKTRWLNPFGSSVPIKFPIRYELRVYLDVNFIKLKYTLILNL